MRPRLGIHGRSNSGDRGGGTPPLSPEDRWLYERIAVLTYPLPPRVLERKDGSFDVQRKMSARWVLDRLKEEGIVVTLRRVLYVQDEIINLGIVEPIVRLSREQREIHRLEGDLKRRFKIPGRVLLVPGFPEMLEPEIAETHRREIRERVIQMMVTRLAELLDEILARAATAPRAAGSTYILTVSGGRTMRRLAEELARTWRPGPFPSPMRAQAASGPRNDQGTEYDANAIVRLIAPVFRATPREMLNEAFVTHEAWGHVKRRPTVADALRSIHEGHTLLMSVGAEPHDEMQPVRGKIVANLCTLMLDEDGREVRTTFVGSARRTRASARWPGIRAGTWSSRRGAARRP